MPVPQQPLHRKMPKLLRGEMKLFTEEGTQSTKVRRVKLIRSMVVPKDTPASYTSNSDKENLTLQYVKDFQQQVASIYPSKKDLFLVARNEYDVPKFVCTTVRPSELAYRELYDFQECADFVANYLVYEPLEHASRTPSCLPSPTQVLKWGCGDSFDFAVLLASYLLGVGYDAYVVYGRAPAWICLRDQTRTECPVEAFGPGATCSTSATSNTAASSNTGDKRVHSATPAQRAVTSPKGEDLMTDDAVAEAKEDSRRGPAYEFRPKPSHESKYLKELWEASKRGPKPIDPFEQQEVNPAEEIEEMEKLDPLHRRRFHAWVLVRAGKRDVQGNFFIEPSTGRAYPSHASPYYNIEAVWNHKNYFVNCRSASDMIDLDLDVTNNDVWEYVMIDPFNLPPKSSGSAPSGEQEMGFDQEFNESSKSSLQEAKKMELNENILDIPLSWVNKLFIDRELFRLKYPPKGGRVTLYHKAKLEMYAENVHEEGLVCRLTLYLDQQRSLVKEKREHFKNRVDRLRYRIHYPMERKVQECFHPGRPGSLREWVEWLGQRRVLNYYVSARLDGLVSREENFGHKIIETFENRPDSLIYRSVHMSSDPTLMSKLPYTLQDAGPAGDMVIEKMTEKYARNPSRHAHEDPAKKTYYVVDGRIRTLYHYDDARVTRPASVIFKDRSNIGTTLVGDDIVVLDEDQLQHAMIAEKECFTAVRHSQMEMVKLTERRAREEQVVKLERPIYERIWERSGESIKNEGEELDGEEAKDYRRVDYLTPFLQNIKDSNNMTKEEARHVRDSCLKALKERLLERANIIQTRLNEETAALSKIQANFQRSQQSSDENVEEYERYCSEALFRIGILESRLAAHEDSALKKYAAMDDKLSNDPRLVQALR